MKLMRSFLGPHDPVSLALVAAELAVNVGPWKQAAVLGIGGLNAVGFDRASETMLVTSVNGQSVIDGATGEILYRNRDEDGLDASALKGTRLDHPADERFDMAGLYGGGLRTMTDDGWSVERIGSYCVLHPAGASVHFLDAKWAEYNKDASFHLVDRSGEEIRAHGFSWTGRTLICATPSTLSIWNRPAPLTL
ncbi:hypothetical protein [Octadecabacter ascidiaceicola]|uniref:Uncharacterized protein n=1 Tax=Octadecabacter ascidiaceicola TaxID=1655543 RepID=A0A238K339_9RHOB|nr:hypothetical protein [Octadecabacter ascidiaceicola]SMX37328.1 hypothetical protein OCA8868_01395 [Octadecabacter ascidiaceicola]